MPSSDEGSHRHLRASLLGKHSVYFAIINFLDPFHVGCDVLDVVSFRICWFVCMSLIALNLASGSLGLCFESMSEETPGDGDVCECNW